MDRNKKIPPLILNGQWNALQYFTALAQANRLASSTGFKVTEVSGPAGLVSILADVMQSPDIIAVDDTTEGFSSIEASPYQEKTKTVFFCSKHEALDLSARASCLDLHREIFRQFLSMIIRQRTRLLQSYITLNPRIALQEIDRHFAPGYACSTFTMHVRLPMDLRLRHEEWDPEFIPA